MMFQRLLTTWLGTLVLLVCSANAHAAFCALRDPVATINHLYPDSVSFRSLVRSIGTDTRAAVLERVGLALHFNELGRHTLYVPLSSGAAPLGLVHVRSELVDRMLVEISWSMSMDYKINDMEFQRCRLKQCRDPMVGKIREQLTGKSLDDIRPLINDLNGTLGQLGLTLADEKALLAEAILRSAMKTLAVSEIAWRDDVSRLQHTAMIQEHFGENGERFTTQPVVVPSDAAVEIRERLRGDTLVKPTTVAVTALLNDGTEQARIVEASWLDGANSHRFRWLINSQDTVLAIEPAGDWPDAETHRAFTPIVGTRPTDKDNCETTAELMAHEIVWVTSPRRR